MDKRKNRITPKKTSGLAIASLVLGILSILLGWIPFFGWIFIILTLVFSIIALTVSTKNNQMKGRGMAIAGLVLGIVSLLIALMVIILIIWAAVFFTQNNPMELNNLNNSEVRSISSVNSAVTIDEIDKSVFLDISGTGNKITVTPKTKVYGIYSSGVNNSVDLCKDIHSPKIDDSGVGNSFNYIDC